MNPSIDKEEFEVCVRAVIQRNDKLLVCRHKEKDYCFFPGGHIDFGEGVREALLREINEELDISIKECLFIGTVENIYIEDGQKHHEINLIFNVKAREINRQSKENHIEFFFININEFSQENILPIALKKAVNKWLRDKKIFWASQIYDKSIIDSF